MKLRIVVLLFGVLSCTAAWCQSSPSDSAKPASISSIKTTAPAVKADASAEQPAKANSAPAFLLDDLHLFRTATDSCGNGSYKCENQKNGGYTCCSKDQDCLNCDGTCHPKGTVHRACER